MSAGDKRQKLRLDHIPSTGDLPIVSEARFLSNTLAFAQRVHEKCGPVSRGWWLFRPSIYLMSAEANELVLFDREGRFSARLGWERVLGELFPRGLMLRDAEDHRWHRRLMLPAFRKEALARYLERMTPRVNRAINEWSERGELLFYPAIKRLTLAIAADVFLGAELDEEIDQISNDFTDLVAASVAVIRAPVIGRTYSKGLRARARLANFIRERITARRASTNNDLFTQLCHARDERDQQYSDEEIVDHLIFIMMAAHDTTTSAITTMVYALAKHPQWQQRLRAEAHKLDRPEHQNNNIAINSDEFIGDTVIGDTVITSMAATDEAALVLDDLARLIEIEWVFKESLRLYQPLPTIARRALKDFEIHGCKIPAGAPVSVFPIQVHRSPLWWHEPEKFDPERFSPQRAEHRKHPFQWTPFGGGAHMCLGLHFAEMQVKAILQPLLSRCSWQVAPGYEPSYAFAPIAKPRDGLPIRISRIV